MGILSCDAFREEYATIKKKTLKTSCSIVAFVLVANVDALCAAKIITDFLGSEALRYKTVPIACYEDISRFNDELICGEIHITTFFFVGCCGSIALGDLLALTHEEAAYIVDDYTGDSVANIFDTGNIHVLDDGQVEANYEELRKVSEDLGRSGDAAEYGYSFAKTSLAKTAFMFVESIKRQETESLWLLAVATNGLYLEERISQSEYKREARFIAEQLSIAQSKTEIVAEETMDLFLHTHWNLLDALHYSSYTASAFCSWKEHGCRKIAVLLAKFGIPLMAAKENYLLIDTQNKTDLSRKLKTGEYKAEMKDLFYTTFMRKYSHTLRISSADMFHILRSLLFSPYSETVPCGETQKKNFQTGFEFLSKHLEVKNIHTETEMAISMQKIRFGILRNVFRKKLIRMTSQFRYTVLPDDPETNTYTEQFQFLVSLAEFLYQGIRKTRKKLLPLVVFAPVPDGGYIGTIACLGARSHTALCLIFSALAERLEGSTRFVAVDAPVVFIPKNTLRVFIRELQKTLSQ
ncbi:MAG: CDC45-like protein [Amphiamblys sp. WSBS2006]|nr:MAG: CDC45-like protein [Amphiamblys sp. WSBS2006]